MKKRLTVSLLLAAAAFAPAARADPDDYVAVPAVEYGEREIELLLGSASKTAAEPAEFAGSLAFGYGLTSWWFTEIYARFNHFAGESTRFDALEWENRFQLTEPGQYFADLGLLLELEYPHDRAEGYEMKIGPLLQKDFGPVQANANFFLGRHYRSEEEEVTELSYQWQLKYRWRAEFEFGMQGFGEMGKWNDWAPASAQEHRIGPAIFGKYNLGGGQVLKYNAAVLFGASGAAPDHTVRAQVEYEF